MFHSEIRICIANITGQMNLTDVDDEAFTSVDDEGREVWGMFIVMVSLSA